MSDSDESPEPEFGWSDFLELARELGERDDEASLRSAVSRAYYATFNTARQVLDHLDPDYSMMRSRDSHQEVWNRVQNLRRRQAKTAHRSGRSLLSKRKVADYDFAVDGWPKRTELAVSEAERAISALSDLLRNT